jgi:hypothetical protein
MDPNLLAFPFDATQYEPYVAGFKTYQAGSYLMAISDLVPQLARGSAENGLLRVEYTIYSEPHMNEKYTEFLNLWHTNDQTREIALRQLSAICHTVGKLQIDNLSELVNLPMLNELDYQEATQGGYDAMGREVKAQPARNRIVRREAYSSEAAAQAQPHKPAQPPFMASQNAAAAAAAPPMANPIQAQPQAAQQAATPAPARQTPPPFAARNGAAQANGQTPPAAANQQTVAAQMQQPQQPQQPGGQAVPPWLQPK